MSRAKLQKLPRPLFVFHWHFFSYFVTGNSSIFTGKIWGFLSRALFANSRALFQEVSRANGKLSQGKKTLGVFKKRTFRFNFAQQIRFYKFSKKWMNFLKSTRYGLPHVQCVITYIITHNALSLYNTHLGVTHYTLHTCMCCTLHSLIKHYTSGVTHMTLHATHLNVLHTTHFQYTLHIYGVTYYTLHECVSRYTLHVTHDILGVTHYTLHTSYFTLHIMNYR